MAHREARSKTAGFAQPATCSDRAASRARRAETCASRGCTNARGGPNERGFATARSGTASDISGPSDATQSDAHYLVTERTATESAAF